MNTNVLLFYIYERLLERYKPQGWWPAESRFEVVIGAILTQATAWTNADKALWKLKEARAMSPSALRGMTVDEVAGLIRSSGYFNAKAAKIKAFVNHLGVHYGDDLDLFFAQKGDSLRRELLSIYGIGEETADDILLYAAHKPFFVIDAYTRRILRRLGVTPGRDTYGAWQDFLQRAIHSDVSVYKEYHALLVAHGKDTCRKIPACWDCCLADSCPMGQSVLGNGTRGLDCFRTED